MLAKAYGVPASQPSRVQSSATPRASLRAGEGPDVSSAIVDTAELSGRTRAARSLVAATVPGGADFAAPAGRGEGAIQMYRHPADKNAAATAVSIGRSLDVNG